ncbi:hypothetical protein PR202_gb06443 [Eleusine coracana subsp. coracana]|uniref:Uncharacterized protein n=1 Tax=Eleusine coracana subsp. coracana TaxID=191504 RepID=A0AAV5E9I5_ELECO|nr:hypothetical protein PR202_gb06443 [Eleusine coracana subsp. coracana]
MISDLDSAVRAMIGDRFERRDKFLASSSPGSASQRPVPVVPRHRCFSRGTEGHHSACELQGHRSQSTGSNDYMWDAMLYRFDWKPEDGLTKPGELDMTEEMDVAIRKKKDLHLHPIIIRVSPQSV